jgi:hypothetical protein
MADSLWPVGALTLCFPCLHRDKRTCSLVLAFKTPDIDLAYKGLGLVATAAKSGNPWVSADVADELFIGDKPVSWILRPRLSTY